MNVFIPCSVNLIYKYDLYALATGNEQLEFDTRLPIHVSTIKLNDFGDVLPVLTAEDLCSINIVLYGAVFSCVVDYD